MRLLRSGFVMLAAACGGAGSSPTPDPGPAQAVADFMQAVADSNLVRMGELWGTSSGPAPTSRETQMRIQVMHAFLKGSTAQVLSQLYSTRDRATLQVELRRSDCVRTVPFEMVRAGRRWIVNAVDLDFVGTPGRECPLENRRPPP